MQMIQSSSFLKNKEQAALKLTPLMNNVSDWLTSSCLTLNVGKTVGMYFSNKRNAQQQPDILVKGEVIKIVDNFKSMSQL